MARGTVEQTIQLGKRQHLLSLTRHSMVTAVNLSEMSFACVYTKRMKQLQNEVQRAARLVRSLTEPRQLLIPPRGPARQDLPCRRAATVTVARVSQSHQKTRQEASLTCLLPAFLQHHRRELSDYNSLHIPP